MKMLILQEPITMKIIYSSLVSSYVLSQEALRFTTSEHDSRESINDNEDPFQRKTKKGIDLAAGETGFRADVARQENFKLKRRSRKRRGKNPPSPRDKFLSSTRRLAGPM